jgi:hypothetical protein
LYWAGVGGALLLLSARKTQAQGVSAQKAARDLQVYLRGGGNFGWKGAPSPQVAVAQKALQVADDGIVGPVTRAAARRQGVELPLRPGKPSEGASPQEWVVTVGQATLTPEAAVAGAVEPKPEKTPAKQKGSVVANLKLQLSGIQMMAAPSDVEGELKKGLGQVKKVLGACKGAPQLVSSPSIQAKYGKERGAFDVEVRWPALWSGSGMPQGLPKCVASALGRDSRVKGVTVARS